MRKFKITNNLKIFLSIIMVVVICIVTMGSTPITTYTAYIDPELKGIISTAKAKNTLTEIDELMEISYSEYRNNDSITGNILEHYDTSINGANSTDYIQLATSLSMNKKYRVAAMNFIVEIYDDVTSAERAYLKSYIQNYAPYSDEETLIEFCDSIKTNRVTTYDVLNRTAAVQYANTYYSDYNTAYPSLIYLGGDCTNFASQCLLAGGKDMDSIWYVEKLNNSYLTPASKEQLYTSWNISDSWMHSGSFDNYWEDNCKRVYSCKVSEYAADPFSMFEQPIYEGDVFQLQEPILWWYEAWHTMIVVGYNEDTGDFIYAGHTNSTNSSTILNNICSNSSYSNNLLKFFHM